MIINLDKIHYYILTTGKNNKRMNHIKEIFKNYNYTFVNPISNIKRYSSGASGMCRIIEIAISNFKNKNIFEPFIILEDDISKTKFFTNQITIPDECDILYMGLSRYGVSNDITSLDIYSTHISNDIIRINNMLSTHSIMITSILGANMYTKTLYEAYKNNIQWDQYITKLQPFYKIYALKRILFYQDSKYGGRELETNFYLSDELDCISLNPLYNYFHDGRKFINSKLPYNSLNKDNDCYKVSNYKNIPDIIHFCFGLSKRKDKFLYCYFLCIYSAYIIQNPHKIIIHYNYEPNTDYWNFLKKIEIIEFRKCELPKKFNNIKLTSFKEQLIIFKLNILNDIGGIFMDIDNISVNNYYKLLNNESVLFPDSDNTISHNLMMFCKNSQFIKLWFEQIKLNYSKGFNECFKKIPYVLIELLDYTHILGTLNNLYYPTCNQIDNIFKKNDIIKEDIYIIPLHYKKSCMTLFNIPNYDWFDSNPHTFYTKCYYNLINTCQRNTMNLYKCNKKDFILESFDILISKEDTDIYKNDLIIKVVKNIKFKHVFNINKNEYLIKSYDKINNKNEIIIYSKGFSIENNQILHHNINYFTYNNYISNILIDINNKYSIINKINDILSLLEDNNYVIYISPDIYIHSYKINLLEVFNGSFKDLIIINNNSDLLFIKKSKNIIIFFKEYLDIMTSEKKMNNILQNWDKSIYSNQIDTFETPKNNEINIFNYLIKSKYQDLYQNLDLNILSPFNKSNKYTELVQFNNLSDIKLFTNQYKKYKGKNLYILGKTSNIDRIQLQNFTKYYDFTNYSIIYESFDSFSIKNVNYNDIFFITSGVFNYSNILNDTINIILMVSSNVYSWNAGFKNSIEKINSEIYFNKFKKIGIRDKLNNNLNNMHYIPCVTCKNELLYKDYNIVRKYGIIENNNIKLESIIEDNCEKISSKLAMNDIIKFIGESEFIITDSQNILYWSTLMNKKVLLSDTVDKQLFKYFYFEYSIYTGNILNNIKKIPIYQNYAEKCKKLNDIFYKLILEII